MIYQRKRIDFEILFLYFNNIAEKKKSITSLFNLFDMLIKQRNKLQNFILLYLLFLSEFSETTLFKMFDFLFNFLFFICLSFFFRLCYPFAIPFILEINTIVQYARENDQNFSNYPTNTFNKIAFVQDKRDYYYVIFG